MGELAERAWFLVSRGLGALLRAGRYSTVCITGRGAEALVRKRRRFHAPFLVWIGGPLLRILDTGVRILPQRDWAAREAHLYRTVHGSSIRADADGTLTLPFLPGRTLAAVLEHRETDESARRTAIELAVSALAQLHEKGFTHGDAMAENVMVDLAGGTAHWFDFETVHESGPPIAWRRADDVRALLATCLVRTPAARFAPTVELILDRYADEEVTRQLAARFASTLQRPLPLHLGQARLSFRAFMEVDRLLRGRGRQSTIRA